MHEACSSNDINVTAVFAGAERETSWMFKLSFLLTHVPEICNCLYEKSVLSFSGKFQHFIKLLDEEKILVHSEQNRSMRTL